MILAQATPKLTVPATHQNYFYRAMLLSLTNPKAILFFLSFFVQFVDPSYEHPLLSFLLLAVILQCISFAYLSVLAFAGQGLARRFNRTPILIKAEHEFGRFTVYRSFAIKLWQAQRQC